MKKIQLITYDGANYIEKNDEITVSEFSNLEALDNFEINVFDLTNFLIWRNKSKSINAPSHMICISDDFKSINDMICNSKNTKFVVILPQNIPFSWEYAGQRKTDRLKNHLDIFKLVLEQLLPIKHLKLSYEKNFTKIGDLSVKSDFYFNNPESNNITISEDSKKCTTVNSSNIYITGLNIFETKSSTLLFNFLKTIGLYKDDITLPDWLINARFFDDEDCYKRILDARKIISDQENIINSNKLTLEKNNYYKSILYTNSDELVSVVYEILENIFDTSLSDFNDVHHEDFNFSKGGFTYIGEIKGVNTNVKNEYISQLEVNASKYLDKLTKKNRNKIVKTLIINYERKTNITERHHICQEQIDLAKKYGTIIIDTKTLLLLFQDILFGKLTKEQVINHINENTGLLDITKIK